MERFNLRSFLLLLLAACFIASAFIPDFLIMVNYNLVFLDLPEPQSEVGPS